MSAPAAPRFILLTVLVTALAVIAPARTGSAAALRAAYPRASPSAASQAPERVIVLLRDQSQSATARSRAGAANSPDSADHAAIISVLRQADAPVSREFGLMDAIATTVRPAEARLLAFDPRVAAVVPDSAVRLRRPASAAPPAAALAARPSPLHHDTVCPARPDRPRLEPEGLELTRTVSPDGRPAAHDLADGSGVTVGILGGAIDTSAPDLLRHGKPVVTSYRDFTGEGTAAPTWILESFGDASSIAAQGTDVHDLADYVNPAHALPKGCTMRIEGVAPGANLAVQKVFSNTSAPVSTILAAIDWSVLHDHVDVLNESLDAYSMPDTAADAIRRFNAAAAAAGVTVVVSSGDAGRNGTFSSPATDPAVLSVGASTQWRTYAQTGAAGAALAPGGWLNNQVSALSSAGTAQSRPQTLDLVAPGDTGWAVCSASTQLYRSCMSWDRGTPSSFVLFNGTSEAAPFAAGAAALVIQAYREAHHGRSPAPALVKQILMSSARDLGAAAQDQGAGLMDSLAAVRMAASVPDSDGVSGPASTGLLVHSDGLDFTGRPGERRHTTLQVTNTGASPVRVTAAVRTAGQDRAISSGQVRLPEDAGTSFADSDGTAAHAAAVDFTVPPGTDRLDAAAAWQPGSASVVAISLIDPRGRLAGYSLPLGPSGYGRTTVNGPLPGVWKAYLWSREGAAPTGAVRYAVTASAFGSPRSGTGPGTLIRPGGTAGVGVTVTLPDDAGDADASVLVSSGGAVRATVPVGLRALVAVGPRGGTFTGTLTGGNGLLVGALVGGQTLSYQFDLPAGSRGLTVLARPQAPGYDLRLILVGPDGMPVTVQDGAAADGSAQVFATWPAKGRWTLLVVVNGQITSGATQTLLRGSVGFALPAVRTTGLPKDSGAVLPADKPVTATMEITNNGSVPLEVFGDVRLNSTSLLTLTSAVPDSYPSPGTTPDQYPQFLVPTGSTRLNVTASATEPLVMDTQPYAGGYYAGDPDVPGTVGTTSVATVDAAALAPTTWVCDANQLGPFGDQGTPVPVRCGATAETKEFAPGARSSTGDPWQTPRATYELRPLHLPPGGTGTLTVTLLPHGLRGQPSSGYIEIGTWNPHTTFAQQLARIPYAYTVG
ncbi:S8 family serine peptidase [Streptomyces sp. H10-C2]|uniref:S8 family serine peptidase n=1 Tax=unclassified Streptomyces TaxID=2593676 RepID=UPI0024BA0E4F|nr:MULTISPECIES: S8 family serine peptidase [unclassified Streptomyces]MDJ0344120.1 S8 family serine peptidase [Streptomyces sp. PH10-H1]MDJ0374876.1 S8 family serine peptidase [Streptomyces sp. H10-C2]